MEHLSIEDMLEMQQAMQEKYKGRWEGTSLDKGRNKILWMMCEVGEVIDVIKKNGEAEIMKPGKVREHMLEELVDVLMFYNDALLCYGITEEELRQAYVKKFERNLTRW